LAELFDDYPTLCPGNVSHVVIPAAKLLFNLLGWQFADSPEKDLEFAANFVALGVVFDISSLEHGLSQVKHKPKRASEVSEQLYNVLAEGSFPQPWQPLLEGCYNLWNLPRLEMLPEEPTEFSDIRIQLPISFLT